MKSMLTGAITALAFWVPALAQDADIMAVPDRAALMQPAPNPAWTAWPRDLKGVMEIAPGVYTYEAGPIRAMFMVTGEGVIATDPISPEVAADYLAAIRSVTDEPIKYLVYSHSHWDHIRGGQVFKDAGAEIVAQENCVAAFTSVPNDEVPMPDITFKDTLTLELGGRSLELIYVGPSHSDCLIFMRPDSDGSDGGPYLFVVDLVTPGGTPGAHMADSQPHTYLAALKAVDALDFQAIIPGHGPAVAHRSAVGERARYLETLMAAVRDEFAAGRRNGPEFEANVRAAISDFEHLSNFEAWSPGNINRVRTFYTIGW